jgi:putative two-component system response regulator
MSEAEKAGDFEALEELEELDSDDGNVGEDEALPEAGQQDLTYPRLFQSSGFPVLFMNKGMKIFYANDSCKTLFDGFSSLEGTSFVNAFGRCFTLHDFQEIREAVVNGKSGSSWKGEAQIRSHVRTTVYTRVYIFPAQLSTRDSATEFGVMFDDVTEENRHLLRSVFMSLLEASKLKDNDTGKHISRVNYYSEALAKKLMSLPEYSVVDADFIDDIAFLAAMHDVGKIGTPDDILNKEGPLSDFEWGIMKEHTKNGAFILSTYPNPMAKEIAISHHEKWDGTGYPFQLEGEMIPLAARIVSIADVYDALRMKRSYKPSFTHDVAMKKIRDAKGTQFDPNLVNIFEGIADEFNEIFERHKD